MRPVACWLLAPLIVLAIVPAYAGTQSLGDLTPGSGDSFITDANSGFPGAYLDGKTYFSIRCEWWKTDGLAAGTSRIVDLTSGGSNCALSGMVAINGLVLFNRSTTELANDNELWRSDGTPAGTTKMTISGFPEHNRGASLWTGKPGYGYLIGLSQTGGEHYEVWSTDGTVAGTLKLAETGTHLPWVTFMPDHRMVIVGDGLWIASSPSAPATSVPVTFTAATVPQTVGSRIVFFANDATHGTEPWGSDLTAGGTQLLSDVTVGSGSTTLRSGPVAGGYAYFTGYDYLFRSDGTPSGTVQLTSNGAIVQTPLTAFGTGVVFVAQQNDGFHLWRSDGSLAGTASITTASIGASNPVRWTSADGNDLLYGVTGASSSAYVWHTSGMLDDAFTTAYWSDGLLHARRRLGDTDVIADDGVQVLHRGKPRVVSLAYGSGSSGVVLRGLAGGSLHYFAFSTPTGGLEPWSMDLATSDVPACSYPGKSTPDNLAAGRSDSVYFAVPNPVAKLRVYLNLPHTYVGDLSAKLVHVSSGTTVTLVNRPGTPATTSGCASNDLDVVLDDSAASVVGTGCSTSTAAQAYAPGTVLQPVQPLSTFRGENLAGEWKLTVVDNAAGDVGGIDSWCLQNVDRLYSDDFQL